MSRLAVYFLTEGLFCKPCKPLDQERPPGEIFQQMSDFLAVSLMLLPILPVFDARVLSVHTCVPVSISTTCVLNFTDRIHLLFYSRKTTNSIFH